jgi:L-aminopeptidase/D-esterase-like protein
MPVSNDHLNLTPRTTFNTPILSFDIPGVLVGVAEYDEGPTGCTVFHFPTGLKTAIDVRGGMVGMTQDNDWCHAICLAGGSLMGLEAVSGVAAGIFAQGDHSIDRQPVMNGAIIYDYGSRKNTIYPDKALGRAALEAAKPGVFPLGARGAGRSAGVGGILDFTRGESSGQGGAYRAIGDVKIAVFTVVNALGAVVDRSGKVVRGNLDHATGQRRDIIADLEERIAQGHLTDSTQGSTTLTVLVINQKLHNRALPQLARHVHSSMARAIRPFHTILDGDVLFAVNTAAVESDMSLATLGLLASELAWDAVLSAVGAG